jgi:hypothetical protein
MINSIIQQIITNFDLAYIITINILTYILIKITDYFNGTKQVKFWIKRVYLVISIIIVTILYILFTNIPNNILINSAIATPVFWSWILKPIISKTKFDYRQIDKTLS